MPTPSLEQLSKPAKALLDSFHAASTIALESSEQIASHQLSAARKFLDESFAHGKKLFESPDFSTVVSASSAYLQPQLASGIDFLRGWYGISSNASQTYLGLLERQHSELNNAVSTLLDGFAQSGSHADVAVAVARSAVSAANSALQNAQKAARQVANIADASLLAATSASTRAVESSTAGRRKAA